MRLRHTLFSIVLVAATAAITTTIVSQDPPAMPDMSVLQPGEHHRRFDYLVGDWSNVYTLYEQPGSDPMQWEGASIRGSVILLRAPTEAPSVRFSAALG